MSAIKMQNLDVIAEQIQQQLENSFWINDSVSSIMLPQTRNAAGRLLVNSRTRSVTRGFSVSVRGNSGWDGKQPEEHVTNRKDKDTLDIQADASRTGHEERAKDSTHSQATSERDAGKNNEKAKKDHPEAPGPIIGMNDERGGVRLFIIEASKIVLTFEQKGH